MVKRMDPMYPKEPTSSFLKLKFQNFYTQKWEQAQK